MISELDVVALSRAFPEYKLQAGDTGTVVDISPDGQWLTVEFMTHDGRTVAVETFEAGALREIGKQEMAQTRAMA